MQILSAPDAAELLLFILGQVGQLFEAEQLRPHEVDLVLERLVVLERSTGGLDGGPLGLLSLLHHSLHLQQLEH